jgi:hypothetical protein
MDLEKLDAPTQAMVLAYYMATIPCPKNSSTV